MLDHLDYISPTHDGGYILGGNSKSSIGGDKTQDSWGDWDYWIIKVDSVGNKQWDRDFGGTNTEQTFGNIFQTPDSGYLLLGTSHSDLSGDKTENLLCGYETWMIKTDSNANLIWDKSIHNYKWGAGLNPHGILTAEGEYVIANYSYAGIGGEKTQPNWDTSSVAFNTSDYWIIKYSETDSAVASIFAGDTAICASTCIDFCNLSSNAVSCIWTFSGGSPSTSFDLNPSDICYNTSGTFDVQLVLVHPNGNDTVLIEDYITVFPNPPVPLIQQNGDTLFINGGGGDIQWYYNFVEISGATDTFLVVQSDGTYYVECVNEFGCKSIASAVQVIVGMLEIQSDHRIYLYPNPVEKELKIKSRLLSGEELIIGTAVSVYNVLGEKVITAWPEAGDKQPAASVADEQWTIECRLLPPGLYILEISAPGKTYRTKFIKQ